MSQLHLIAKSFKEIIAADGALNVALPGNLHYGDRLRPEPGFVRPYAVIVIKMDGREHNSGGSALVEYQVMIKVWGGQDPGDVGAIQQLLDAKFTPFVVLPSITGRKVGLVPTEGWLLEDDDEDQDLDVMVASLAWLLVILE